jgi:hypothetical protein
MKKFLIFVFISLCIANGLMMIIEPDMQYLINNTMHFYLLSAGALICAISCAYFAFKVHAVDAEMLSFSFGLTAVVQVVAYATHGPAIPIAIKIIMFVLSALVMISVLFRKKIVTIW